MAVIVSDTFTRANSTSVVGAGEVGPAPTAAVGTWGIATNQLYASAVSSSNAILYWECGTANVDITVKKTAGSQANSGIFFGAESATVGWYAAFSDTLSTPTAIYRYRAGTILMFAQGKSTPALVNASAVLRLVVHSSIVQMWSGSTLLLEVELSEPSIGTLHGIRAVSTTHRFDDLVIQDSSAISLVEEDSDIVAEVAFDMGNVDTESFLYRGRDTKAADAAGGS